MTYSSILLSVQDSPHQTTVTDTALCLTDLFGAHITGLHVHVPGYEAYVALGDYPVAPDIKSIQRERIRARERATCLQATFAGRAHRAGIETADWRYQAGELGAAHVSDLIALHARYADLVVIGQCDPQNRNSQTSVDTPALIAASSARPVLVLPHTRTFDTVGQRVLVAWNASREATRAITAALPLLARAATVEIVVVDEDGPRTQQVYGDEPGADIALFAARHGVHVSVSRLPSDGRRVAAILQSRAADTGADLLVMGAYGHSRLRELMFGGVTYDLLHRMTLPTLIAN